MTDPRSDHTPDADPMNQDPTARFLENMPELKPGETLRFACHPGVPCFNACCSGLTLTLTPYDAFRLRTALGLSGEEFAKRHGILVRVPGSGFPVLRLRMLSDAKGSCPFVRAEGCSVYPDRPASCRTYPVGRATRALEDGTHEERFFLVRERHCRGFEQEAEWTMEAWAKDQGLTDYNRANDRFAAFMSRLAASGIGLDQGRANMAFLALYQTDRFKDFLAASKALDRLDLPGERTTRIMEDEGERLAFAQDWMEMLLFGPGAGLSPKKG